MARIAEKENAWSAKQAELERKLILTMEGLEEATEIQRAYLVILEA